MSKDGDGIEDPPLPRRRATLRALGHVAQDVRTAAPPATQDQTSPGRRVTGGVGLRQATAPARPSMEGQQKRRDSRKTVTESQSAHRQAVWDKLDAARAEARKKTERIETFRPARAATEGTDDLDDFDV